MPATALATSRETLLEQAIDRLTARLASAGDDEIGELVSERRDMRGELRALRESIAGVISIDSRRTR